MNEDLQKKAREIAVEICFDYDLPKGPGEEDEACECIEQRIAAALADERERCVKLLERFHQGDDWPDGATLIEQLIEAIRSQKG